MGARWRVAWSTSTPRKPTWTSTSDIERLKLPDSKGLTSYVLHFRSTELDLPYPDLKEYIADLNVMMALVINGPV